MFKAKEKYIKNRYVCQCKNGHIFHYGKREKYSLEDKHYASCQGGCPVCGTTRFSFVNESTHFYGLTQCRYD